MGEMPGYFACAGLAIMGGTLLPFGGQNLIEAAACGCPVLLGPHTFNFAQASEDAIASKAAYRVKSAENAMRKAKRLFENPEALEAMRRAAVKFNLAHQGATVKTLTLMQKFLKQQTS